MRYREHFLAPLLTALFLTIPIPADPIPPEIPYSYDYQLPPGPAQPIIEYYLKPPVSRAPAPAPVLPPRPAPVVAPAASSTVPETNNRTAAAESVTLDEPGEPDLFARPGEPFTIALEGGSWLFTAAFPKDADIDYRGRSREESGMRFSFVARDLGRFLLEFVKGSSQGEGALRHTLVIEVLPESEFMARIGAVTETDPDEQNDPVRESPVEEGLTPAERYDLAWEAALAGRAARADQIVNDPELGDLINDSELLAARFIFSRLAEIEDPLLFDRISSLSAVARKSFSDSLLAGIERFGLREQEQLFHFSLNSLGGLVEIDRYLFHLAELYQKTGPLRDIDLAVEYYSRLIEDFPLSTLWDEARQRKVYLERHFLLLR